MNSKNEPDSILCTETVIGIWAATFASTLLSAHLLSKSYLFTGNAYRIGMLIGGIIAISVGFIHFGSMAVYYTKSDRESSKTETTRETIDVDSNHVRVMSRAEDGWATVLRFTRKGVYVLNVDDDNQLHDRVWVPNSDLDDIAHEISQSACDQEREQ